MRLKKNLKKMLFAMDAKFDLEKYIHVWKLSKFYNFITIISWNRLIKYIYSTCTFLIRHFLLHHAWPFDYWLKSMQNMFWENIKHHQNVPSFANLPWLQTIPVHPDLQPPIHCPVNLSQLCATLQLTVHRCLQSLP